MGFSGGGGGSFQGGTANPVPNPIYMVGTPPNSHLILGYDGSNNPAITFNLGTGSQSILDCNALNQLRCQAADFDISSQGRGLRVNETAGNSKQGTATLVAGTVTVNNIAVTATSRIFLTSQVDGGTPGFLRVSSRVAGTSFTVTSSNAADTSTFAYEIFEPG